MNYRHLSLCCDCGEIPERLAEVGFSEDHQLVVHWWCEKCQRVVYVAKPLTECWLECPGKDHSLDHVLAEWSAGAKEAQEDSDARFLRSLGIAV
jgi:hypothetical protein